MVKSINAILYCQKVEAEITQLAKCLANIPMQAGKQQTTPDTGIYQDEYWSTFIATVENLTTEAEFREVINNLSRGEDFEQWVSNTLQGIWERYNACMPLLVSIQSSIVSQDERNHVWNQISKYFTEAIKMLALVWGQDNWPIDHSLLIALTPYATVSGSNPLHNFNACVFAIDDGGNEPSSVTDAKGAIEDATSDVMDDGSYDQAVETAQNELAIATAGGDAGEINTAQNNLNAANVADRVMITMTADTAAQLAVSAETKLKVLIETVRSAVVEVDAKVGELKENIKQNRYNARITKDNFDELKLAYESRVSSQISRLQKGCDIMKALAADSLSH